MPSPFPGMDPYLEAPGIWPDFHDGLAGEISGTLNAHLPERYYAQLGSREEIGIVGEEVAIPSVDPEEVNFVEIRDARLNHEVVTIIEILSPANKLPGKDQGLYLIKRDEVLGSQTSLIEIDLLRCGDRSLYGPDIHRRLAAFTPPPEYVVLINRSWNRSRFQLFPAHLPKPLPVIPIPLREGEPEPRFDLQAAITGTYVRGPYARGAVDYTKLADPPIDERHREWVAARLTLSFAPPAPSNP